MVLNPQDVGLEESISSGMPERIVDQKRATRQSECEIKFGGGDDFTLKRYGGWRLKFLRRSYPGIEWTAGDCLMMGRFVACGIGTTFFVMAAIHIRHCTRVDLLP
jgi:hypothetical protein